MTFTFGWFPPSQYNKGIVGEFRTFMVMNQLHAEVTHWLRVVREQPKTMSSITRGSTVRYPKFPVLCSQLVSNFASIHKKVFHSIKGQSGVCVGLSRHSCVLTIH